MRIGINCITVDPSYSGGINTYTLGLIEGFARVGEGHSFQLYVTSGNQHLFERWTHLPNFCLFASNERSIKLRKALRRLALYTGSSGVFRCVSDALFHKTILRMDVESDLLYTPTTVLLSFNSRVPTVLSMHDIQQFHYPEFFSRHELLRRRITFGLSARHANYLQASSQFIRQDLLEHFPFLKKTQVTVVPEGVNIAAFRALQDTSYVREKYELPDRFLFMPAQLWPHKNHITVLSALNRLRCHTGVTIPLVMTGAKYGAAPSIVEFITKHEMDYVRYLGTIPFADLKALYREATLMITAALYESNSLPILEAAASGTPIIASRTPPNEELARTLSVSMFSPKESNELADLLLSLWKDEANLRVQADRNQIAIEQYSWDKVALSYLDFFRGVLNCEAALETV